MGYKYDPEKKRRELKRRGWSEKRIDAYMNHRQFFSIQKEAKSGNKRQTGNE